jgi:hypothetical protein
MQTTIGGFALAAKFRYRPCYPYTLPNLSAQHRYTFVLCANKITISSIYVQDEISILLLADHDKPTSEFLRFVAELLLVRPGRYPEG